MLGIGVVSAGVEIGQKRKPGRKLHDEDHGAMSTNHGENCPSCTSSLSFKASGTALSYRSISVTSRLPMANTAGASGCKIMSEISEPSYNASQRAVTNFY